MKTKQRFGYNAAGHYVGPLKKVHRPGNKPSLVVRCLAEGTLDIDLETGAVISKARGSWLPIKPRQDEDGYWKFTLKRDTNGAERRKKDSAGRRRLSMEVFVHRLAMIKKLAVAAGETRWRNHVKDLPAGMDVHHRFGKDDNRAASLTLELPEVNRPRLAELDENETPF